MINIKGFYFLLSANLDKCKNNTVKKQNVPIDKANNLILTSTVNIVAKKQAPLISAINPIKFENARMALNL